MHRNLLAKINRLIIATVVLFGMTATASASESQGSVIPDNVENAACERLDIEQFASRPIDWLSEARVAYIEAYVDNRCETEVPNVSREGRIVDLAYMNELFKWVSSGRIVTSQNKAEFRIDVVQAKIEKELQRANRSGTGLGNVEAHDVATVIFLHYQIEAFEFLEVTKYANFNYQLKRAEAMSREEKSEIVNDFLFPEEDKKRYKDKIKNELEK